MRGKASMSVLTAIKQSAAGAKGGPTACESAHCWEHCQEGLGLPTYAIEGIPACQNRYDDGREVGGVGGSGGRDGWNGVGKGITGQGGHGRRRPHHRKPTPNLVCPLVVSLPLFLSLDVSWKTCCKPPVQGGWTVMSHGLRPYSQPL